MPIGLLENAFFFTGSFPEALEHLDHAVIARFDKDDWEEPFVFDTKVAAYGHACIAYAISGSVDTAHDCAIRAVQRAEQRQHLPSLIFAKHCQSVMYVILRDPAEASRLTEDIAQLTAKSPFPLFEMRARLIAAWSRMQLGEPIDVQEILEPFSMSRSTHARASRPFWLSLIAECLTEQAEYWFALHVLDEELEFREETGDAFYAAELFRLRAKITAACQSDAGIEEVLEQYQQSIHTASRQGAYLFQLRAAVEYLQHVNDESDREFANSTIRDALSHIEGTTAEIDQARKRFGT